MRSFIRGSLTRRFGDWNRRGDVFGTLKIVRREWGEMDATERVEK